MNRCPCKHLIAVNECAGSCGKGYQIPESCDGCADYVPGLDTRERTRCEVWSRVMGYHRPVDQWNAGKKSEHSERKHFRERPGDLVSQIKLPRQDENKTAPQTR